MSKSPKKRAASSSTTPVPSKPSQQPTADPKRRQTNPGSKQARVITMLQSPNGATIAAIMEATGWQQHSVRGFLAAVVRKRLKLKLGSKKVDGERVYQVASGDSRKSEPSQSKRRSR